MKAQADKLTDEQKEWMHAFIDLGYYADICYSADEAIDVIKQYLKG